MEYNKELTDILKLTVDGQLRKALDALESFAYKFPEVSISLALGNIREDYNLMTDYWQRGFQDSQRSTVYTGLLRQLYTLTSSAMHEYAVIHQSFLSYVNRRVRPAAGQYDAFLDTLQTKLEGFVSDVAMLEFEPELTRAKKKSEIFSRQQQLRNNVFDYIWTSGPWKDNVAEALQSMALSPTVDTVDQQLIVIAVSLAVMDSFDICKLRMLVNVYLNSTDENVRQRALVGWTLSLNDAASSLFPEQRQLVEQALADPRTASELTELQMQMIYCMNAEQDNQTIQNDIMPTLLKHNNLHITPHGIEEKEEDALRDILDPEASERGMEKLEESFKKMIDMQKAGSDIYFSGFSQMKRFAFFNDICNWFVAFYPEHPGIEGLMGRESTGDFVRGIVTHTPFCNSDKYSFVLAFQQVVDRMPANVREIMKHGSPVGSGVFSDADMQSAAYIRRSYLQDLYRFFRLYPSRSIFCDPFSKDKKRSYNFFSKKVFQSTGLEKHFCEMAAYMMKRRMNIDAQSVLDNISDMSRGYQYYLLQGNLQLRLHTVGEMSSSTCFAKALTFKPNDRKAMTGQARALFYEGEYVDAADVYSRLIEADSDNNGYVLAYCVCLTNLASYDKALPLLYKLNFEHPDDMATVRVMARALTGNGKYEQAMKHYETLVGSENCEPDDLVNCGYCAWFMGRIKDAVDNFLQYLDKRYPSHTSPNELMVHCKEDIIDNEYSFIISHGISETEMQLMIDAVYDASLR